MTREIFSSITEAIGNTPMVALDRLTESLDGQILAKLEYLNPGYSKKDRAALGIIEQAEQTGDLSPGQPVVELTSGNMGTGLAMVCSVRGYPFIAVMSRGNSSERARMMRALGAEVILVDQADDSVAGEVSGEDLALVEKAARSITIERGAFRANQFFHQGNPQSHYRHTGPEIWQQSGGKLSAFCDFAGSGGSFAGVSRYLREQHTGIQCYLVEPEGAAALAGEPVSQPGHPIQGGGYSMPELAFLEEVEIDGFLQVSAQAAQEMCHRLAKTEGIFAGYSSGANVAAAIQLLEGELKGGTVAVLLCDSGLKYLSTDLWS
jgi:cysteine synthase A